VAAGFARDAALKTALLADFYKILSNCHVQALPDFKGGALYPALPD
jgi:hypothetical protein